jgi:KipI family sensor histidine kinase inhibitor
VTSRLTPYGEHALLVELDGLSQVLSLDGALHAARRSGEAAFADLLDVVPAARTVLVMLRDGADVGRVRQALAMTLEEALAGASEQPASRDDAPVIEIGVHYDGPDLDEVAELTGLSPEEVVERHTGRPWRAAFAGFAPGFVYLAGGDPELRVRRRSEPRTSVPPGSVGLAGEFSAVYPRSSPGGWQLLGRTEATMWDVDRQPPALVQPGAVVSFFDADRGERR